MSESTHYATLGDVSIEMVNKHVALVEMHRPPNNNFDVELIRSLADAYEALDGNCRAIVLCSEGKHFCAGADFAGEASTSADQAGAVPGGLVISDLYRQAVRIFQARTPVVAAVQGAAIGGGLGLACAADFRVTCPEARLSANFAQLGFHHGFGLTVTLPALVGQQVSLNLLLTGRRIKGDEAVEVGLCERLVPAEHVRSEAMSLAVELASSAPLAVRSIRATMRGDLADRVRDAMRHEQSEQDKLARSADWREGIAATAERRPPRFSGT